MVFFLFAGYGAALFYSEESVDAKRTVWKAVFAGLAVSMVIIALSVYSELVAVPQSALGTISSAPIPELAAWITYIPAPVLLALNMIILVVSLIVFGAAGGSAARLLWAMSRDGFIKSNWLKQLHPTRGVPHRSAAVNFILSLAMQLAVVGVMVKFYGYNANTIALAWFVNGTAATIFWYLHHFVPEFGLFAYLTKHPKSGFSTLRKITSGLIIPIAGALLFIYTFYEGIISDTVEPFLAFVIFTLVVTVGIVVFIIYKHMTGGMGESVVSYSLAESGGTGAIGASPDPINSVVLKD